MKREKLLRYITKIFLIFIILQPLFDVYSNLANNEIIRFNFITYFKPLFVFAIYFILFVFYKYKGKWKQIFFLGLLILYLIAHSIMLYAIFVDTATIIHEIRFLINIMYFIIMFFDIYNIFNIVKDKDVFYNQLKKTLLITVFLYVFLYILAVLTNTSWLTYEFADKNKLGFRGWNFSGQILGHLLSISLPMIIYMVYNMKLNNILKVIGITLLTIPFLLIGTKVPYYILIIVCVMYLIVNVVYKVLHHNYKINKLSCFMSLIIIVFCVVIYHKLPVYHNIVLNNTAISESIKKEDLNKYANEIRDKAQKNKETIEKNKNSNSNASQKKSKLDFIISSEERLEIALKYEDWTFDSLEKLNELYDSNNLHSADTRNRQTYFLHFKFMQASAPFKLLGLGYLNQPNGLSIERDIIMPFYSFGICGFILLTSILWVLLGKMIFMCLRNIKKLEIETIFACESFCMFFFISFYAGYTYIYPQFSNILAIIMCLLNYNLLKLNKNNKTKN